MAELPAAPRVSVVMPVFNGEAFLAEAVESVLGQTLRDIELVAVDDGSDDSSLAILDRFHRADPRVSVVTNGGRLGISAALNLGLRQARAAYVARADADDVSVPERFETQVTYLDAHPEIAAVGSAVVTMDGSGRSGPVLRFPTEAGVIRSTLLRRNCLAHPSVLFRRSAVVAVGGYRFDHVEDYDLWLRLSEHYSLGNLSTPLVHYRIHQRQVSRTTLNERERLLFAVRVAARARLAGQPDPLSCASELTPEIVAATGVDEREVARRVRREWLSRAAILAELGDPEGEELIQQVFARIGPRAPKTLAAQRELLRAEGCLAAQKRLEGITHVGRAFLHDPLHTSARLGAWLGDRFSLLQGRTQESSESER